MKTIMHRILDFFLIAAFFILPFSSAQAAPTLQSSQPVAVSPASVIDSGSSVSAYYNTNLIPDGDAEYTSYLNYWVDNEGWSKICLYGDSCGTPLTFPSPYDPGPTVRGSNFYYMGTVTSNHSNGTNVWIKNKIDLTPIQSAIDSGKVRYIVSGYFGGVSNRTDTARLHLFFEYPGHQNTDEFSIGDVTAADRQNKTSLLYRERTGYIPPHTQYINMVLQSGTMSGTDYRTGFADNLSLKLIPPQVFLPAVLTGQALPPKTGFPAPTGVVVIPDGLTRMDIYWTDNSSNELGFEVQRINPDASIDTICNTKPNVTYCLDPGIKASSASGYVYLGSQQTYTYQVRAIGPGIDSAWASGSGTTATMPQTVPSPTHGAFTCQSLDTTSSSTTFVWNDPFNYEAGFALYANGHANPDWDMLEGGTKISFINQVPGTITLKIVPFVYDLANPGYILLSNTSCTATAVLPSPSSSGITRFSNNASYPVISLVVDGWEQFPVRPLAILPGAYYELTGVPAGQHTWTATTGFWDDWGQRFSMYNYAGSYNQPASGPASVTIPDMTIKDLLTVPPANLGYWEGYYFDSYGNCFTTAFKFKQDGTFTFYNANSQVDSGTYSLVQREPDIFSTKFHVNSSKQNVDGLLIETQGEFFLKNGPPSWLQITYVYKPQGYVRNPFCP